MDAKIVAAAELLNAAAKEKKEDLQNLFSEKFDHLKEALVKPKEFVKDNPWWVAGGIAVTALAAGLIYLFLHGKSSGKP